MAEYRYSGRTRDGVYVYLVVKAEVASGQEELFSRAMPLIVSEALNLFNFNELTGVKCRRYIVDDLRRKGIAVSNVRIITSFRCPRCNASLEYSPESVMLICSYCGWVGNIYGVEEEAYFWKPVDLSTAFSKLSRRVGGRIRLSEYNLKFVPVYVYRADVDVSYRGYKVVRGSKGRVRYVPRSGAFRESIIYPVILRMNTEIYGEEFRRAVAYNFERIGIMVLDSEHGKKYSKNILAPEVSCEEAEGMAVDGIEDHYLERVREHLDGITSFNCKVNLSKPMLVFTPIWTIIYEAGRRIYRAVIDGVTGNILVSEAPLGTTARIGYIMAAYGVALAAPLALEFLLRMEDSDVFSLVLIVFLGAFAFIYKFISSIFKPYRRVSDYL